MKKHWKCRFVFKMKLYACWFAQASFKASAGHMPAHTSDFCTWNNSFVNELRNYTKSFTLWWRTQTIGCDLLFLQIKSWFKKLAAILWSHDESYTIQTEITCWTRWCLVFLCRTKDEEVMAIFLKSCSQKLEKEGKWRYFKCLYVFDKGKFHCTLQSLAPSEVEFNSE